MLSFNHEILVDLFRENIQLAAELQRRCAGTAVDQARVTLESIDLTQVAPTAYYACMPLSSSARPSVRTGRRVLGRRAVLAQSWRDSPASREPRRNLRPQVAERSKWARIEALLRNRTFVIEYVSARDRWQHGMLPCSRPAPTGSSGSRRCQSTKHDSSGSLSR